MAAALLLALGVLLGAASSAVSASADIAQARYLSERNQLGLLQFCVDQHLVDADVVTLRLRALARLGTANPTTDGDAEEAAGRRGVIAFTTSRTSFVDDAKGQGISLRYSCEQLALRVVRLASP